MDVPVSNETAPQADAATNEFVANRQFHLSNENGAASSAATNLSLVDAIPVIEHMIVYAG
jgi:hypothetical protein